MPIGLYAGADRVEISSDVWIGMQRYTIHHTDQLFSWSQSQQETQAVSGYSLSKDLPLKKTTHKPTSPNQ